MEKEDKQQCQQSGPRPGESIEAVLTASGVQTVEPGLYGLLATLEETCVCNLQVASCFMSKEISAQQMFQISI